jgi:hypothetical protein
MGIELITFLGSYLLSFVGTLFSNAQKKKAQFNENILKLAGLTEKSTKEARKTTDRFTKTTRRFLAFFATIMLIGALIILGAYEVPMFIEVKTKVGGWFLIPERTITEFIPIKGVPVLVEYRLILVSIFGLYFGNNHAK